MGDAPLNSQDFVKELDKGIPDHKYRGTHRYKSEDIDIGMGEEDRKGEQDPEYRPRSAKQYDSVHPGQDIHYEGEDPRQGTGDQIKEKKFPAPHLPLHLGSEEKQTQHIEEDVGQSGMGEHIGDELPYPEPFQDESGNEGRIIDGISTHHIEEKNSNIYNYQSDGEIFVGMPKGASQK